MNGKGGKLLFCVVFLLSGLKSEPTCAFEFNQLLNGAISTHHYAVAKRLGVSKLHADELLSSPAHGIRAREILALDEWAGNLPAEFYDHLALAIREKRQKPSCVTQFLAASSFLFMMLKVPARPLNVETEVDYEPLVRGLLDAYGIDLNSSLVDIFTEAVLPRPVNWRNISADDAEIKRRIQAFVKDPWVTEQIVECARQDCNQAFKGQSLPRPLRGKIENEFIRARRKLSRESLLDLERNILYGMNLFFEKNFNPHWLSPGAVKYLLKARYHYEKNVAARNVYIAGVMYVLFDPARAEVTGHILHDRISHYLRSELNGLVRSYLGRGKSIFADQAQKPYSPPSPQRLSPLPPEVTPGSLFSNVTKEEADVVFDHGDEELVVALTEPSQSEGARDRLLTDYPTVTTPGSSDEIPVVPMEQRIQLLRNNSLGGQAFPWLFSPDLDLDNETRDYFFYVVQRLSERRRLRFDDRISIISTNQRYIYKITFPGGASVFFGAARGTFKLLGGSPSALGMREERELLIEARDLFYDFLSQPSSNVENRSSRRNR